MRFSDIASFQNQEGSTQRSNLSRLGSGGPQNFSYTALISGCDFEAVFFMVYVCNGAKVWRIPARYKIRKLPKSYNSDRRAGQVRPFSAYARYVRDVPETDLKVEVKMPLLENSFRGMWNAWTAEEQKRFDFCVKVECVLIVDQLNLGALDYTRFVVQQGVDVMGGKMLTGWGMTAKGNMRFFGIRKRRLFEGYLGEPLFERKKLDVDSWYMGEMGLTVAHFCSIWREHPSILPIVAYGVLALMHTPKSMPVEKGRYPIDFALPQPIALIVTGRRRDSLAAARVFADTNYDTHESRAKESWLDTLLKDGNFFEPYVHHGYFQNITLFENNEAEQLEPELLDRWRQSYAIGLHSVAWMPELKRTACRAQQMTELLCVLVRAGKGPVFQAGKFDKFAAAWRGILREYIIYLEHLDEKEFRLCSIQIDSNRQWRKNVEFGAEEQQFLRQNRCAPSLVFAFGQMLEWFKKENFISWDEANKLLNLLVRELMQCEKLFCESEIERLRRYLKPLMADKKGVEQRIKRPYVYWNGREQRTHEHCLYIEARHWEKHYRRMMDSTASSTELMCCLKPYLIRRPDRKALGLQRMYHSPDGKENRKIYVLCIEKNRFLKDL